MEKTLHRKTNWRRIGALLRQQGGHLAAGAICTVLAVALSFAAPLVVSFTLDYVVQGLPAKLPSFLHDWLAARGGRAYLVENLALCGAALVLCTALNGVCTFLRRREIAFAAEGLGRELRNSLDRHLADVPCDYPKHASTGDLVQRCTSDVDTVRRFVSQQLTEIVRTLCMVAFAAAVMLRIHPRMALISMSLMPQAAASSRRAGSHPASASGRRSSGRLCIAPRPPI